MILLFELTFLGVLLSLVYGWLLEFALVRTFKFSEKHSLHVSVTILLGAALIAGLLGLWSFFAPVTLFTVRFFCIIALPLILIAGKYILVRERIVYRQILSINILSWILYFVFFIFMLYYASASDVTYDTGLYHAQSIRWIESYPVVPGIANIHDRLGFNSNLFLLAAFWGFADKGWFAYQIPSLVIFSAFLLYCLHLMNKSGRVFAQAGLMAAGYIFFLLAEKGMIVWFASPTADLPVGLLSWVIFLLAMEKLDEGARDDFDMVLAAMLLLSLFDMTLKISTAPILLLPIYFLLKSKFSLSNRSIIGISAFCSLIFLPWIARNMVISGYLIFPFYQLDILNVDWKVPHETAKYAAQTIAAWGRIPYRDPSSVMSLNFSQWFPVWIQNLHPEDLYLISSFPILSVLLFILTLLNKGAMETVRKYGIVYAVASIGFVYWFLQSPSPRFGYGFLVTLSLLAGTPILFHIWKGIKAPSNILFMLIQIGLIVYTLEFASRFPLRSWKHYLNSYKEYPVVETRSIEIGSAKLFLPIGTDQCWYDAFPCGPFEREGLALRGETIEDGFYINENGQ